MDGEEKLWFGCCICYHVFENPILLHKHRNSKHSGISCPESLILAQEHLQPLVKLKRCGMKQRPRSSSTKVNVEERSVDFQTTSQDDNWLTNSRKSLTACSEAGSDLTTALAKKSFAMFQSSEKLKEPSPLPSTDSNYSSNTNINTNHLKVNLDAQTFSITTRTKVKVKQRKRVRLSPKTELKNAKPSSISAATIIPSLRPDATLPDVSEKPPRKISKIKCRIWCREFRKGRKLKQHIIWKHLPKFKEAKANETKASTKSKLSKLPGELKVRDDSNQDQPIVEVHPPSPTRAIAVGKKRKRSHQEYNDKEDKAEKAEKAKKKIRNSESPEPELCEPLIWIRPAAEYLEPEELEPEVPSPAQPETVPRYPNPPAPAPLFMGFERVPQIIVLHQTTNSTNNNNSQARLKHLPDARLKNLAIPASSSNHSPPQDIGVAAASDPSVKFAGSAALNNHVTVHSSSKPNSKSASVGKPTCKICNRKFKAQRHLEDHLKSGSHKNKAKTHEQHILRQNPEPTTVTSTTTHIQKVSCRICKREFTSKLSLLTHEEVTGHGHSRQQEHTDAAASTQTPFNCEKCESLLSFPSAAALEAHRRISCPKLLRCKRCDVAAFGTFEQLVQHENMCQFRNVPIPQQPRPRPSFPPPPFAGQFQSRMQIPQGPPFRHPPPGYHLMDAQRNDNSSARLPPPPLFYPLRPNFPDSRWNGSNYSYNNYSNFSNYYSFS